MRIAYICLSPTLGMHQYTADLANRTAARGCDVHLVSTARLPDDRYAPTIRRHMPLANHTTGFSVEGLQGHDLHRLHQTISRLKADVVHFTAPHAWNPLLLLACRREGRPTMHTLHDLDPHQGTRFGFLIRAWNRAVVNNADHILVHGQVYRQRLLNEGKPAAQVTATPLLHLSLGYAAETEMGRRSHHDAASSAGGTAVLFFGRLLPYKGLNVLLSAWQQIDDGKVRLVVAGPGEFDACWSQPLPAGVELRNRWIGDDEAVALFRDCALLILPYVDATQSALVATAYFFHRPVIVTSSGALAEYVRPEVTGWVTLPGDATALATVIKTALTDAGRLAAMGLAARRWYDDQRAIEMTTLQRVYEQLAARSSSVLPTIAP